MEVAKRSELGGSDGGRCGECGHLGHEVRVVAHEVQEVDPRSDVGCRADELRRGDGAATKA